MRWPWDKAVDRARLEVMALSLRVEILESKLRGMTADADAKQPAEEEAEPMKRVTTPPRRSWQQARAKLEAKAMEEQQHAG